MQISLKVTNYIGTILLHNDFDTVTCYVSCKNFKFAYFHM